MFARSKTLAAVATVLLICAAIASTTVSGAQDRRRLAFSTPTVETGEVEAIGPRGGIAIGLIDPNGHVVHFWVAFGRNKPSEHHTGLSEETLVGSEPAEAGTVLENLREGTTYRYRVVAIYAHQTKKVFGSVRSFTTKCYFEDPQGEVGVRRCHR